MTTSNLASYWASDLCDVGTEIPAVDAELPQSADVVVVGGGYTGLSAAIAAHDCGARVVVLEREAPGAGASTVNGGMFGTQPRLSWSKVAALIGSEGADRIFAEAGSSLRLVQDLIKREKIECSYQPTGRISLAWTKKHLEAHRELAASFSAKSGLTAKVIERDELSAEINSERYFGAILYPDHGAINPRQLLRGLLDAVLRRGIEVVSNCEVHRAEAVHAAWNLSTSRGAISAKAVILATNGYNRGDFGWNRSRVFPLPSYLIATEELDPKFIAELAPGRRMMVETRARHSYFRISPDGKRILYGGRASMRPVDIKTAANRLHSTMCEVWPQMRNVRVERAWTGNTGYSFIHMPAIGDHNGIFYANGYSGSGTVMAPYLGTKVGWRAVGDSRSETAYDLFKLPTSPLHPTGVPWFLYAADLWYRMWVDRFETRAGRGK